MYTRGGIPLKSASFEAFNIGEKKFYAKMNMSKKKLIRISLYNPETDNRSNFELTFKPKLQRDSIQYKNLILLGNLCSEFRNK